MSLVSSANLTVGEFSFLYLHSAGYRENKKEESSLGSTSNGVQSITNDITRNSYKQVSWSDSLRSTEKF